MKNKRKAEQEFSESSSSYANSDLSDAKKLRKVYWKNKFEESIFEFDGESFFCKQCLLEIGLKSKKAHLLSKRH